MQDFVQFGLRFDDYKAHQDSKNCSKYELFGVNDFSDTGYAEMPPCSPCYHAERKQEKGPDTVPLRRIAQRNTGYCPSLFRLKVLDDFQWEEA